eukprot:CAMPEP_0113934740 /NCGR_PEP_ID=MMETSP1339-20121228/2016_1 /TAXON_ID=94617 /ORGANISM="Fibrocapsa japonica" /LENGTH=61 /DNA_ID=CAMNT_0000936657 /DNA_START=308 /DNA_END=493 /DNA_ORIENTATION=- /assembly_acc=CAM_ASM_000762
MSELQRQHKEVVDYGNHDKYELGTHKEMGQKLSDAVLELARGLNKRKHEMTREQRSGRHHA